MNAMKKSPKAAELSADEVARRVAVHLVRLLHDPGAPVAVRPADYATAAQVAVTGADQPVTVCGPRPDRRTLVVQNNGNSDIEVGGADLRRGSGYVVEPSSVLTLTDYGGALYATKAAAGGAALTLSVLQLYDRIMGQAVTA